MHSTASLQILPPSKMFFFHSFRAQIDSHHPVNPDTSYLGSRRPFNP